MSILFDNKLRVPCDIMAEEAYPSNTASPNGRVVLVPPRKRFQMICAKASPSASFAKDADPVAPPSEMVTIFPAFWHVWISEARNEQSGSCVPGNAPLEDVLQVYEDHLLQEKNQSRREPTLARFTDGKPPVVLNSSKNAIGMISTVLSYHRDRVGQHGENGGPL